MMRWNMYNEIMKLKNEGLKRTQVARRLNSDKRTIKKYWNMSPEEFELARANFKQRIMGTRMDIYKNQVLNWLREYPELTGAQIYDWLKEEFNDFSMAERTVRKYVSNLREKHALPKSQQIRDYTAVAEVAQGEQGQVDMGQIKLMTKEGKTKKLYLFTMVLSHSRYKFSQWQTTPFTAKDLIKMHNLAFKYFGGIPKEIVYDQDRAIFVSENSGDIIMTSDFQKYIALAKYKIHLCRAYDPESKGKIEAVVKYVKNNFAKNRIFTTIEEFNQLNDEWLIRTGNGKIHSTIKKIPAEVFALEKHHLQPVPTSLANAKDSPTNILTYSLGKDNTVTYKSNRYQLPKGTYSVKNKEVGVIIKDEYITFLKKDSEEVIAVYKISKEKGILLSEFQNKKSPLENKTTVVLEQEILEYFKEKRDVTIFLEKIKSEKGRYLKEQLTKLKEIIEKHPLEIIEKILREFLTKEITNLSVFNDTAEAYSYKSKAELKKDEVSIKNIPEIMKNINPELRKASEYQERLVNNI